MKPKVAELSSIIEEASRYGGWEIAGNPQMWTLKRDLLKLLAIARAAHELELEHENPVMDATMRKLCRERLFAANAQLDWSSE